jgi:PAS domain S-box-containing protein
MLENITERKASENALAAEKERLLVTLRSIGDAVIATDVSGSVVLMNKVAETLTGWTLSEAQGKPLGEVFVIINELTRKPCDNPVDKVLSTGSIVNLENHTVLIGKSGVEYVIADSGAPIKDRDGKTIGVILVFRDNTEKQKTQEAMQKAQQLESIGVLAGGIAHDFNNLLSGLFGYLDLARESLKRGEEPGQYIEKAFSVFGRAKDLTGQLLTFSKGGAPARKIALLAPLVRDAVHFALSGSTITCRFTIAPDLWPASFDENQISQVVDNVVINARDAMPMGGTISVTADNIPTGSPLPSDLVKGNFVRICVSDQGTGISPEHLPRIFDPFFTTKQKGSGLGLATAYSIVKRHDGVITANSELGKGATICMFLPASTSAADGTSAPVSTPPAHKGRGAVLVMDDEDFIRDVAAAMLSEMGYTVTTALHGAETLSLFEAAQNDNSPFDLVILDLTIPGGMGGRQAKDELRKLMPTAKIIASSGYSDDPIMSNPQEFGFDAAVRKPYDKAELAKAVSMVMGKGKS